MNERDEFNPRSAARKIEAEGEVLADFLRPGREALVRVGAPVFDSTQEIDNGRLALAKLGAPIFGYAAEEIQAVGEYLQSQSQLPVND